MIVLIDLNIYYHSTVISLYKHNRKSFTIFVYLLLFFQPLFFKPKALTPHNVCEYFRLIEEFARKKALHSSLQINRLCISIIILPVISSVNRKHSHSHNVCECFRLIEEFAWKFCTVPAKLGLAMSSTLEVKKMIIVHAVRNIAVKIITSFETFAISDNNLSRSSAWDLLAISQSFNTIEDPSRPINQITKATMDT